MDRTTRDQLYHFVDDLEEALGFRAPEGLSYDEVILCGVGGSAVSGDFVTDCCTGESTRYICSIRYPDLPSWVGPRTLAIVSSYSGNTAETVEMYRQSKERGCGVVVLTSGGTLRELAIENGDILVPLPEGMHPRHAIGYMIGYTLRIVESMEPIGVSDRILGMIPSLRAYRDRCAEGDRPLARELASRFMGRVPVVCIDSRMPSVAFRWKTQINENSKLVAFCESSPGFIDSEAGRWDAVPGSFVLALLTGRDDGPSRLAGSLGAGDDVLEAVDLGGGSPLENMFRAIILGDYTSIFMAEMRGVDPAEVRPVMRMKEKLSRAAGADGHPRASHESRRMSNHLILIPVGYGRRRTDGRAQRQEDSGDLVRRHSGGPRRGCGDLVPRPLGLLRGRGPQRRHGGRHGVRGGDRALFDHGERERRLHQRGDPLHIPGQVEAV